MIDRDPTLKTDEHSKTEPRVPIVEKDGGRFIVVGFTDIDGTVNKETEPEINRISTINEAKDAIKTLQEFGINFGVITARSLGEAELYLKELSAKGFAICEDGASLILPAINALSPDEVEKIKSKFKLIEYNGKQVVILGSTDKTVLENFLRRAEEKAKSQDPINSGSLINTIWSSPQEIQRYAGHATLELAMLSTERAASAYAIGLSEAQINIIQEDAKEFGLRTFMRTPTDALLIFGATAHKGDALRTVHDNIQLFYPNHGQLNGIIPVVFGNHTNDVPLFEEAFHMGGMGVIVQHPDGGYAVPDEKIPPFVIKAEAPYGYGMRRSIPQIINHLNSQYNLGLQLKR